MWALAVICYGAALAVCLYVIAVMVAPSVLPVWDRWRQHVRDTTVRREPVPVYEEEDIEDMKGLIEARARQQEKMNRDVSSIPRALLPRPRRVGKTGKSPGSTSSPKPSHEEQEARMRKKIRAAHKECHPFQPAEEPSADHPDAISIMFRFPRGKRLSRRFLTYDTVQTLYEFICSCEDFPLHRCVLKTGYPMQTLEDRMATLREMDIEHGTVVIVEVVR